MSEPTTPPGGQYDRFLDALADGEGFYLADEAGNGYLPPRAVGPLRGEDGLVEEPLPETGEVESYTVVHVPPSGFVDDAPYALAIVDMGSVRLTGLVRDIDPDDVDIGLTVEPEVVTPANGDDRLLGFYPQENA